MEFEIVGGHTFCPKLLKDGVIIDVGCRGFEFASHFEGRKIFCIDLDPKVFDYDFQSLKHWMATVKPEFLNVAISDKAGETTYYENGEATMIREVDPDPTFEHIDQKYSKTCKTITMDDLYKITGENVDVLKLDCEGAEYIILGETFKPIPKQITVEMHRHCVPVLHDREYPKIIERLNKDYIIANDPVYEKRHGCPENWWDILFIRKW